MHKKLSHATGGVALVPPTWSLFQDLITPHPFGGCNMGKSRQPVWSTTVARCSVIRGLYVATARLFPRRSGVNPSRTIGALAERAAGIMIAEGR